MEEVAETVQYDTGIPTNEALTKPDYVIFVDETGLFRNQRNDDKVGEQFIIVKVETEWGAQVEVTTELHFTVHLEPDRQQCLCNFKKQAEY